MAVSESLSSSTSAAISSSIISGPSVTLEILRQRRYLHIRTTGSRFRIEVTDNVGLADNSIFRYMVKPPNLDGEVRAYFSGVCSIADLEDVPPLGPDVEANPRTFRLNYVDLVLRNPIEIDGVPDDPDNKGVLPLILEEINSLLDSIALSTDLIVTDTQTLTGSS